MSRTRLWPAVLLAPWLAGPLPGTAEPPGTPEPGAAETLAPGMAPEVALLEARIRDARALLASLETLEKRLAALAHKALDDADAAPTPDERRRYEQLYTETSARLGELQATRADLQTQLGRLESQRDALGHDR